MPPGAKGQCLRAAQTGLDSRLRKPDKGAMKANVTKALAIASALLMGVSGGAMRMADMTAGEVGTVRNVLDGDTLYFKTGLKIRLSGMQAPKLSLGREGFKDWPLGEESKAALTALTAGRSLQLYYGGAKRDRYKRALAQVHVLDDAGAPDIWVQEEMIRLGMGRVYTWPDTYQDTAKLYAAETEARAAGRGIWALPYYAVRKPDPDPLAQDVDSFQLVEGIVTSVADIRGTVYVNFGANYKTDFTIIVPKKARKRFKKDGFDPLKLEGALVRVRGWVELKNGPMMWLDHPQRLEVLDGVQS